MSQKLITYGSNGAPKFCVIFCRKYFPKVVSFFQKYAILLVEIVKKRQPLNKLKIINKKCHHLATSIIYYNVR